MDPHRRAGEDVASVAAAPAWVQDQGLPAQQQQVEDAPERSRSQTRGSSAPWQEQPGEAPQSVRQQRTRPKLKLHGVVGAMLVWTGWHASLECSPEEPISSSRTVRPRGGRSSPTAWRKTPPGPAANGLSPVMNRLPALHFVAHCCCVVC